MSLGQKHARPERAKGSVALVSPPEQFQED
jgi:hypothetical protein